MPMQTNSTLSNEDSASIWASKSRTKQRLQPREATLQTILQFAATHKTVKITDEWMIEVYLN